MIFFLLPALVLALWGGVILRLKSSGLIADLQNPFYHPLSMGAAGCCLLLALLYPLIFSVRPSVSSNRRLALMTVGLLLAAPVAIFMTLPKDNPTTGFLARRISSAANSGNLYRLLGVNERDFLNDLLSRKQAANGERLELDLLAVNFIANHAGLKKLYRQSLVTLSGQYLHASSNGKQSFRLVQMIMFCCAADAKVLGIGVDGEVDAMQDGTWLNIDGVLDFDADGTPYLVLQNARLEESAPPPDLPLQQK